MQKRGFAGMSDKYMKIKKWLWLFSVIFLVIAVYKSFGIDRLAHKIAPSTIHVAEIGWTGCTQIDEETWDYTYRLPTLISSDQIVSVATYWVGVNVYVDQTLVFSYFRRTVWFTSSVKLAGFQSTLSSMWASSTRYTVIPLAAPHSTSTALSETLVSITALPASPAAATA